MSGRFSTGLRGLALAGFFALLVIGALVLLVSLPYKNYGESEKFVWIPRGTSSTEIARVLEENGIIRHQKLFLIYIKTLKRSRAMQAGEYRFDSPLTIPQVAEKLIRGQVFFHEFTIPEGYSIFDISDLLVQRGFASNEAFQSAVQQVDLVADLAPGVTSLEGFLFPDTYRWTRGVTAEDLVRQMVARFRQVVSKGLLDKIGQARLGVKDVVTLASLIEKETGVESERALVSAVFHNRLSQNIPLQCDPTVVYAAKLNNTYRGEIYRSDLQNNSPYNTYVHAGLPPGPIASPGLRSLEAALNPAEVNYLYFVSDNEGGHVFSETLDEHNRAVAAYRKGLRERARNQNKGDG